MQHYGLHPARLLCPWDSLDKSTRVGCHALLQGIFPTQGSNPGLLHCRQSLPLSHQGSPKTYREPRDTRKDAQHHWSSGKFKSKPQWAITSYLSRWLLSKRQQMTSVGQHVKKTLTHCWWECKLVQSLWKLYGGSSKKKKKHLKIELPYNTAIPLPGIYQKQTKRSTWKDICISVFTTALFTAAKIWKQPKHPLIDEWTKIWHKYNRTWC